MTILFFKSYYFVVISVTYFSTILCLCFSKVYLTFDSNYRSALDRDSTGRRAPGTISLALCRAIKMRHLQIPITLALLP